MKNFLLLFLSLGLGTTLVACGDDTTTDDTDKTPENENGGSTTPDTDNGGSTTPDTDNGGSTTPEVEEEEDDEVIKSFKISFDSNGGSQINTLTYTEEELTVKPTDPTKPYGTFMGWQLNGQSFTWGSTLTSDITLVAMWTWESDILPDADFTVSSVDFETINKWDTQKDADKYSYLTYNTATAAEQTDIFGTESDNIIYKVTRGPSAGSHNLHFGKNSATNNLNYDGTATMLNFDIYFTDVATAGFNMKLYDGTSSSNQIMTLKTGSGTSSNLNITNSSSASGSSSSSSGQLIESNTWNNFKIVIMLDTENNCYYYDWFINDVLINESPVQLPYVCVEGSFFGSVNFSVDSDKTGEIDSSFYLDNIKVLQQETK